MGALIHKQKKVAETVDTPVQGIVTQAEFDALPAEQQSTGFYVIDDGDNMGGSSMEVYDDQERVIGTWFGKPMYRKIFEILCNFSGFESREINLEGFSGNIIDDIVKIYGGVKSSSGGKFGFDGFYLTFYLVNDSAYIASQILSASHSISGKLVLEYTKTTDQGVTT